MSDATMGKNDFMGWDKSDYEGLIGKHDRSMSGKCKHFLFSAWHRSSKKFRKNRIQKQTNEYRKNITNQYWLQPLVVMLVAAVEMF